MLHSILTGKSTLVVSKLTKSAGSTWPGHVALKVDPSFVKKALKKNPDVNVILIAGTNGKTTTTKLLTHILEKNNISVLTNKAGANLLNGLASLLVTHINLKGKLHHKALLFEVDENSLPLVLSEIPNPKAIILLNLFRDQLDRYGEVNSTSEKWVECFKRLSDGTTVIANADDPLVAYTATFAKKTSFFSIRDNFKTKKALEHAVDSITCPKCNNALSYSSISYSHLGNYSCTNCGFKKPKTIEHELKASLYGTYNQYNLNAAYAVAKDIFSIEHEKIMSSLENFTPAFGRQEQLVVNERKIMLLLSKNPTGFNESLKVVKENKSTSLLILLNDRIPDGRDISWIWDVDFEELKNLSLKIYVSGDRAFDLANRLLFAGVTHEVFESYTNAYSECLKNTKKGEVITILPTYSAMLEIRKHISGKSIL